MKIYILFIKYYLLLINKLKKQENINFNKPYIIF